MTLRVQQALNDANLTAVKYSHQQIDIIHLIFCFSRTRRWINSKYLYKDGH